MNATLSADAALGVLRDLLENAHSPPMVLTGAGCSTQAGIPAYRDRRGEWAHPQPIQFAQFRRSEASRRRYWARSFTGWPRFHAARPTPAHQALAWLAERGRVVPLVTQNVDRLHSRAGAEEVVDLHGRLDRVRCLDCGIEMHRATLQTHLEALNGTWSDSVVRDGATHRPDGDRDVSDEAVARFRYIDCERCGGILKPDVVFFGENVPAERLATARERLANAGGLLVVGSSLMVLSGYRFVREALAARKPVLILTQGRTRADDDGVVKLDHECGELLSALVRELGGGSSAPAGR
ncbi:MAG: NAD-dependent protein deacetylase [Pseudomonadota bacterium]